MTITVKHKFVSTIPDSVDTQLVRPTNWNDEHDLVGTVIIANGGTNGTATPTAGTIAYGTGTAYAFSTAGTAGQTLLSNGASAPTWGTPAGSLTITDDTTTASVFYPTFTSATSGTITGETISSTNLQYTPSTGYLYSTKMQSTGYYLTGATAGAGALYYNSSTDRVTLANYNVGGMLLFEVNGGAFTAQFNGDGSIQFLNIYTKNVTTAPKVVCMDSSGIIGFSNTADFTGTTVTATTGNFTNLSSTNAPTFTNPLPIASGGTGATVANGAMANLMGFTSTVASAGTTTLTNTSSYYQLFTGTLTQTIVLPVTSTIQQGWTFHICNNTSQGLTVNSSGGNLVISIRAGTTVMVTCILATGTTAASWESGYTDFSTVTGDGAVVLATNPLFTGITATGLLNLTSSTTGTVNLGTAQTTGTLNIGGTSGTGTQTIGQSTVSQTTNIQAGATASGSTKTVNFGTGGLTGSTTTMAIGSTFGTSVTANGNWYFSSGISGGTF